MGFCVYFHRTWTPGYNSEYIDPNLAFSFQRKLNLAKKIAWWIFVLTLLACVILLLVTLYKNSLPDAVDCPDNLEKSKFIDSLTTETLVHANVGFPSIMEAQHGENLTKIITEEPPPIASFANFKPNGTVTVGTTTEEITFNVTPDKKPIQNQTGEASISLTSSKTEHETTPSIDMESEADYESTINTTETSTMHEEDSNPVSKRPGIDVDHAETLNFTDLLHKQLLNSESEDDSFNKRNMTTRESNSLKHQPPYECQPGDFICNSTQVCIPRSKRCDGRLDCLRPYQDEIAHASGTLQYNDRSDELNCPCRRNSYFCNKSSNYKTASGSEECLHMSLVCDSVGDCSNGRDEEYCVAISQLDKVHMDKRKNEIEGYLLVRVKGSWHPYCYTNWTKEMGPKICEFLGYKNNIELQTIELNDLNRKLGSNFIGKSEEVRGQRDTVWLLGGNKDDYTTMSSGSIEDAVTESTEEKHMCEVAYIICSKF